MSYYIGNQVYSNSNNIASILGSARNYSNFDATNPNSSYVHTSTGIADALNNAIASAQAQNAAAREASQARNGDAGTDPLAGIKVAAAEALNDLGIIPKGTTFDMSDPGTQAYFATWQGFGNSSTSATPIEFPYAPYASLYGMDIETAYQEALANSAHQREVADLKAAGLNPVLSAGAGSGSAVFSGTYAPVLSVGSSGSGGYAPGSGSDGSNLASKVGNLNWKYAAGNIGNAIDSAISGNIGSVVSNAIQAGIKLFS